MNRIVLLPGDGIGPEVTREARRTLELVSERHNLKLSFDKALIGGASIDKHGTPLHDDVVDLCRRSRAVLLGAVGAFCGVGLLHSVLQPVFIDKSSLSKVA